jgi:uncharacterized protein (DUF305 family)
MTAHRSTMRRLALTVTALAATAALTACGGDSDTDSASTDSASTESTTEEHNAADVSFAQGMIPHHRQAVEMAQLAAERASSPEVTDLATRIDQAQQPEIDTLTGWLESWGEQVPEDEDGEEMAGMDHDGHDMSGGMAGEQGMTELENASGEEFDAIFLELMIEHHEGAVSTAETERAEGAYAPATEMAEDIVTSQSAEIDEMNALLGEG